MWEVFTAGGDGLTDSQPENVLYANKIWHTAGTQYGPSRDVRIAPYPRASAIDSHNPARSRSTSGYP